MKTIVSLLILSLSFAAQAIDRYEYPVRGVEVVSAVPAGKMIVSFTTRHCVDTFVSLDYKIERLEKRNIIFVKAVAKNTGEGTRIFCVRENSQTLEVSYVEKEGDLEPLLISLNTNETLLNSAQMAEALESDKGVVAPTQATYYYAPIQTVSLESQKCPDNPHIACMPRLLLSGRAIVRNCNDKVVSSTMHIATAWDAKKSAVNAKVLMKKMSTELPCPAVIPQTKVISKILPIGVMMQPNPVINNL